MYGIILPIDFHIFKMVIAPPTRYALQMIYGDVPGPTWTLSYEKNGDFPRWESSYLHQLHP